MPQNADEKNQSADGVTAKIPRSEGPIPRIRTMRGDVGRLFQKDERALTEELAGTFEQEPPAHAATPRRNTRAVIIAIAAVLLIAAGGIAVAMFVPKRFTSQDTLRPPVLPPPLFATEATRDVTVATARELVSAIAAALVLPGPEHTFTRLSLGISGDGASRFAEIPDLFPPETLMPPTLRDLLNTPAMIAIYHGPDGNRLVLAAHTSDIERTLFNMIAWEPMFEIALRQFTSPTAAFPTFADFSYRNIDGRHAPLPDLTHAGAGYAMFPATKTLIIATGDDALKTVIDRLFEAAQ